MAKKKSKKNQLPDAEQNTQGIAGALGENVRTVGATFVGALVGELVEAAVERLIQKAKSGITGQSSNGNDNFDASNATSDYSKDRPASQHHKTPNAVQSASIGVQENLQDSLGNVKLSMRDAIDAVRAAVGDVTPRLTDIVDTLKVAPQRSKHSAQRSVNEVGNSTKTVVQEVVDTAMSAVAVVADNIADNADHISKKSKKKNKKKKNKK